MPGREGNVGEVGGLSFVVDVDESVQSITRTLGILELVVWVLDCVGSRVIGEAGGERIAEKGVVDEVKRRSRMGMRT